MSPVTSTASEPISIPTRPIRTDGRNTATSRRFIRKYEATPASSAAPLRMEAASTWAYAARFNGWVSTAQTSFISARAPSSRSSLTVMPTGFCMNELAAMMKNADSMVPIETSHMQVRCSLADSLSQPKIHRPRKVDSRKKASNASMASGAPKTSPTNRE